MNWPKERRKACAEMERLRIWLLPTIQADGMRLAFQIDLDDSDENRVVKDALRKRISALLKLRDALESPIPDPDWEETHAKMNRPT